MFTVSLNNVTCFQLDAIPTVGFSDSILSYLSAFQYSYDGVRMLRDGYEKVLCPSLYFPSSYQTDDRPTSRQDQVYSKLPLFGDGSCWLPDQHKSKTLGRPQMMSCLLLNHRMKYVSVQYGELTHEDYLVPSTEIHTRLIEPEGWLQHGRNSFQINPGY